jgi:hypothetical protein
MANVQWNKDFFDLKTHAAKMPSELRGVAVQIVNQSVKEGASIMYDNIDRIDTEQMKSQVSYEDAKGSRWRVSGKFGWGLQGTIFDPYYIFQEQGFRHYLSGKNVPPMHALLRAFMVERERFYERVRKAVK